MSRVGKMPITVPQGVDVSIANDKITVKGTLGTLTLAANSLVEVKKDGAVVTFAPVNESQEANALSGTFRALVNNLVNGVSKDEIREIFMQVAIYAGVPAGVDSFRIAREVFAEIDKG